MNNTDIPLPTLDPAVVRPLGGGLASEVETRTVLVVEDDADIAFTLKLRLRMNGFCAVVARDFQTALELAKTESVDVALLDMSVPGGDGLTLLGHLRRIPGLEDLPTAILTASLRPDLPKLAQEAGAQAYFTKPFNPVELIAKLDELTGLDRSAVS